ncbi:MAG: 50S ribosomal protein L18 [Candidatus Daviesbacteria bacterium]|nr:50S ribosomal protein L18 [Candidatus Daviesbacteria bacterium]
MKKEIRVMKHLKIRQRIYGTQERPRLSVFRSSQHIFAQLIDDKAGKTYAQASDLKMTKEPKNKKAYEVGRQLAAKALKLKIKKAVFDRGGFLYSGRVESLAKGAREGGLEF